MSNAVEVKALPELCVANREANLYHDSYFYSTFYVPETDEFVEVMVGTTAFAGGTYSTDVKAPAELIKLYHERRRIAAEEQEARTVRPNKKVTIDRTRKFKGMVGTVRWIGPDKFNYGRTEVACVEFENGYRTYPALDRLTVVQQ